MRCYDGVVEGVPAYGQGAVAIEIGLHGSDVARRVDAAFRAARVMKWSGYRFGGGLCDGEGFGGGQGVGSGGPEESHLQSPTDPCVTVSRHTALIIQPTTVGFASF
jgi:hypothetical protein